MKCKCRRCFTFAVNTTSEGKYVSPQTRSAYGALRRLTINDVVRQCHTNVTRPDSDGWINILIFIKFNGSVLSASVRGEEIRIVEKPKFVKNPEKVLNRVILLKKLITISKRDDEVESENIKEHQEEFETLMLRKAKRREHERNATKVPADY